MRFNNHQSVVLGLATPGVVHSAAGLRSRESPSPDHFRAWAVKNAFKTSWEGYYDTAFPHDSLHPVSESYEDDRFVPPPRSSQSSYLCTVADR